MLHLTKREYEVCKCIALGMRNSEIADKLFISTHTVKVYVSAVIEELNAKNRTQAAYLIGRLNIIEP